MYYLPAKNNYKGVKPYEIKDIYRKQISFVQFCNGTFIPENSKIYINNLIHQSTAIEKNNKNESFYTRSFVFFHKNNNDVSFIFSDHVTNSEITPYCETIIHPTGKFKSIWEYLENIKTHFLYKHFTTYFKNRKFSFLSKEVKKIYSKIDATEITNNDFSKINDFTSSEYPYIIHKKDFFKSDKYISIGCISSSLLIQYELYKKYTDLTLDECIELYELYLKTVRKDYIFDEELFSFVDFIKESKNNSYNIEDVKNMIELQYSF